MPVCERFSADFPSPERHFISYMLTPIKYLRQDEVQQLFTVINKTRDRALFAAIYHYALRVTEATMLNLADVDFEHGSLFIRRLKRGRGGEFPLLSNTAKLLKRYLPFRLPTDSQALFTSRQGRLSRRQIQRLFKRYLREAGLDDRFTVHSLRHSVATHLLDAGFDPFYVQAHLGHTRLESTQIYAQVTSKQKTQAFRRMESNADIVKF